MLRGIFPVIPTMFDNNDRIDTRSLRQVVRFAINYGAHGVVFPGVASEVNFLSAEERGELVQVVCEEVAGAVPIIGGASAASSDQCVAFGREAIAGGASHLMIMAPASLGADVAAQRDFFQRIAAQLEGAEIILQNAPPPNGAGLDAEAIAAIVEENPSITYTKEETLPSGPVITALQARGIPHLQGILGGGGARYLIDELNRGAVGALPAVELTDLHVALFDAYQAGDHPRAREIYRNCLPLLAAQMIYRMRLTKYVLKQRGLAERLHVRAPLPELDEFAKRDIDTMLSDLHKTLQ